MSTENRKVAFVTGASRGIGAAASLLLARAGFDVAITARTVREGDRHDNASSIHKLDTPILPGSLATTAARIREEGREVLSIASDLLDRSSLESAVATVLEHWGRIDVLVNNAIYVGPGQLDTILDTTIEMFDKHLEGIVTGPLLMTKLVLPQMIARGGGVIINVSSGAASRIPPAPGRKGGWGVSYGAAKAALHKIAGFVALEHAGDGIRAYNVQPGFVASERMVQDMADMGFDYASRGAPPAVVGSVITWLADSEDAVAFNGENVEAQPLCHKLQLLPGWQGPAASYDADTVGEAAART